MIAVELNTVLPIRLALRCLAVLATLTMLSLGSTAPAGAFANCAPGFMPCDTFCIPTVNQCCGTGGGQSCRDACWISNVGPICCPRWAYGTLDGRCVAVGYSAKPARAVGEQAGERGAAPIDSTAPEKGVPPKE